MNNDPIKPSIVIVSSSNTKPKSLIKLITKTADLSETVPHRVSTSWKLDTKYYKADIDVHGITEEFERDADFNESVEALIVHIDTNKDTGLEDIKVWERVEDECGPEIKLLIANYCNGETKVTKAMATEWCLSRGYELIELYPNLESVRSEQAEEIMKEKFGVERIVEALQAHVWPNLDMKENPASPACSEIKTASESSVRKDLNELLFGIDSCMSQMDDFAELFSKLQTMKESIQSLPSRDRKKQAEEMVTAFWRAIGGDEDEIDLSDT